MRYDENRKLTQFTRLISWQSCSLYEGTIKTCPVPPPLAVTTAQHYFQNRITVVMEAHVWLLGYNRREGWHGT